MRVIIKPIITEKMTSGSEKFNRYGFVVEDSANKLQIKKAIEDTYGVTVDSVRTMRYVGKVKVRNTVSGVMIGRANKCKKAVVTLKNGESIDFYSSI